MLAIYLLTLGTSAGIVGVFVRQVLADAGYVSGFGAGVQLACGAASAYIVSQLLFMTVVRFVWPTRSHAPIAADGVSHAAALFLLPYLMGVHVAWPHPALYQVEPLIYLSAFVAVHSLLKLFSLYAILHSAPGPRWGAVLWLAATALFCLGAYVPSRWWLEALEASRPHVTDTPSAYESGGVHALARVVPEGSAVQTDLPAFADEGLTFRWANRPDGSADDLLPGVHVTVVLQGAQTTRHTEWVPLREKGWSALQIPQKVIPPGLTSCSVMWYQEQEPKWRAVLGIRPVLQSGQEVLVAGPFPHAVQTGSEGKPSFLILVVDGLGTDRVSGLGYARETTPSLDRLCKSAVLFPNAYTPAPEPAASVMTLLTGLCPLRHGFLGNHQGPLPAGERTLAETLNEDHYATAAFTEGDTRGDLVFGTGFERGFETYDGVYVREPSLAEPSEDAGAAAEAAAVGSEATLDRAFDWIVANKGSRFMVFVRLSELRDMTLRERYGKAFIPEKGAPPAADIYDSGLAYLDRSIGAFLKNVRDEDGIGRICVVVTATHGADFAPPPKLTESVLCIPIIIEAPGLEPLVRTDLAALEDLAPALATMAGVSLGPDAKGSGLLTSPTTVEPVSMAGDPLVLTMRNDRWRLYWSVERSPFSPASIGQPQPATLYDLAKRRAGISLSDEAVRYPDVVEKWTNRLERYVTLQSEGWMRPAAPAH